MTATRRAKLTHTSSPPEVAGDAALLVDPLNVEEMAEAVWKVIHDEKLRTRLKERAHRRLRGFDWRATAAEVLRVLEDEGRRALR